MDYNAFRSAVREASEVMSYPLDEEVLMDRWLKSREGRWGSDVERETEPQGFTSLEMALEDICPNISYLQFRRICRTMVHYDSINDDDYYNSSVYYMKYVRLNDLYDYLKGEGLI